MTEDILVKKCKEFNELKEKKKELEKELQSLITEMTTKEKELFKLMFDMDIQSINIDGKLFYREVSYYPQIRNKPKFFDWLRFNGFGDIITETVNFNTLRAWYKEYIGKTDNEELPEDLQELISVYEDTKVKIRKMR